MLNIFSIVLNGSPWLEAQWKRLLPVQNWKWVIVEGAANPVADTSWCGAIPLGHCSQQGWSVDGTFDLLNFMDQTDERVTVIRRQGFWPGKTAMCNAALAEFSESGVLLQLDVDEFWPVGAYEKLERLFDRNRFVTADFICRYFLGSVRKGLYQLSGYTVPWHRAFKFQPGDKFKTHEPPVLNDGDILQADATANAGLVFDHYGYCTPKQVEFKQAYYRRPGLLEAWQRFNQCARPGEDVHKYFPWFTTGDEPPWLIAGEPILQLASQP